MGRKTNKQRTIEAIESLIERYSSTEATIKASYTIKGCPLCKIHNSMIMFNTCCKGCPMACKSGGVGCTNYILYPSYVHNTYSLELIRRVRRKLYEYLLAIIEDMPKERFTKKGWSYINIRNMEDVYIRECIGKIKHVEFDD